MKPISIRIPIWDTYLYILPYAKGLKKRLKKLGVKPRQVRFAVKGRYDATTLAAEYAAVIVVQPHLGRRARVNALSHEVFHVAQDILADRGVYLRKNDTNESHAYLVGYLMGELIKRIKA